MAQKKSVPRDENDEKVDVNDRIEDTGAKRNDLYYKRQKKRFVDEEKHLRESGFLKPAVKVRAKQ